MVDKLVTSRVLVDIEVEQAAAIEKSKTKNMYCIFL